MKKIILVLLKTYRDLISPLLVLILGNSCRFTPTCSQYTLEAVEKYGVMKGIYFGIKRIICCNPFNNGGHDPLVKTPLMRVS